MTGRGRARTSDTHLSGEMAPTTTTATTSASTVVTTSVATTSSNTLTTNSSGTNRLMSAGPMAGQT